MRKRYALGMAGAHAESCTLAAKRHCREADKNARDWLVGAASAATFR